MNATNKCAKEPHVFTCECGNKYKHHSSLWKHRKTCSCKLENKSETATKDASPNNSAISNDALLDFLKNDFKNILVEVFKNGIINNNSNNTNSHNRVKNKFNMNFFLNEKCKDAMNIMDFVNTMQLQLSDLERVGELGYVKGISHIIVNKLKDLDITERPVHCSDVKRETMYVKDDNVWEKDETKKKMSKMIMHVGHKNQKQIGTWQQENPEYRDGESAKCDDYLKIVSESMSGLTNDDEAETCTNKIIQTIAKEITIEEPSAE